MIEDACHNSNCNAPDEVNRIIESSSLSSDAWAAYGYVGASSLTSTCADSEPSIFSNVLQKASVSSYCG